MTMSRVDIPFFIRGFYPRHAPKLLARDMGNIIEPRTAKQYAGGTIPPHRHRQIIDALDRQLARTEAFLRLYRRHRRALAREEALAEARGLVRRPGARVGAQPALVFASTPREVRPA